MTEERIEGLIKDPEYGEFCFNRYGYKDDQVEEQTEQLREAVKALIVAKDLYDRIERFAAENRIPVEILALIDSIEIEVTLESIIGLSYEEIKEEDK